MSSFVSLVISRGTSQLRTVLYTQLFIREEQGGANAVATDFRDQYRSSFFQISRQLLPTGFPHIRKRGTGGEKGDWREFGEILLENAARQGL
jgi:hypothetical protein